MKLTRRKLRRLLKESIIRLRLSESMQTTDIVEEIRMMLRNQLRSRGSEREPDNEDIANQIVNKIRGVEFESDLMYYGPQNIQKMVQVLQSEIATQKKEYDELDQEYNRAQRTERGRLEYPPDWWDQYVFPIDMQIEKYQDAISDLRKAIGQGQSIMGIPITPLTEEEEYTYDSLISDTLLPQIAYSDDWTGREEEFRQAILDEIEEQIEYLYPRPPEDRWGAIAKYVMDEYYNG